MKGVEPGEQQGIESLIPTDLKCREDMTVFLQVLDGRVAAQVEDLAANEPSVIDSLDNKIEFIRKTSDLAGQRKIINGLVRLLNIETTEI